MRLRALTLSQKSLLVAASVAASLGIVAVPASAGATAPTATEVTAAVAPAPRSVDYDAAYFASVARGAAQLAQGKVSSTTLKVQIALVEDSASMSAFSAQIQIDQLRELTSRVAAQVVSYDKSQARKAAEAKAAEAKAAKEAARKVAARQSTASPASVGTAVPVSSGDNSPAAARAYARSLMASKYGWGADQFTCLNSLWNRESGWRVHAANPSGAYGIPQALPGSKMGAGWQNSAQVQVAWGLGYIKARYGTPCGAWGHSQSVGWY
ncbi:hypothetical protein GCM10022240_01800 [Microbacterium kribbense]|uniref:Lytic transglycosylase domain-containing protein n=1 Tax=Microbacterium kribbense TaxID=433645 RepID=A0ABP7G2Z2_9MICO